MNLIAPDILSFFCKEIVAGIEGDSKLLTDSVPENKIDDNLFERLRIECFADRLSEFLTCGHGSGRHVLTKDGRCDFRRDVSNGGVVVCEEEKEGEKRRNDLCGSLGVLKCEMEDWGECLEGS